MRLVVDLICASLSLKATNELASGGSRRGRPRWFASLSGRFWKLRARPRVVRSGGRCVFCPYLRTGLCKDAVRPRVLCSERAHHPPAVFLPVASQAEFSNI